MSIVATAVPAIERIGLLEAWHVWFSGQQPPSDAVLWFMSLRWWARAGKIAAFLGGAVVILDLLGNRRLREIGERWGFKSSDLDSPKRLLVEAATALPKRRALLVCAIWVNVAFGIATIQAMGFFRTYGPLLGNPEDYYLEALLVLVITHFVTQVGYLLFASAGNVVARMLGIGMSVVIATFNRERPAQGVRWAAFMLFVVGFHFDLLAS